MSVDAAALLLERQGLVPLTPARAGALTSLVELVVGGRIRGSWWAHPRGRDIYACASALDERGDVLAVKLVDGRVTFVARRLWAALLGVVTDEEWRAPRVASLPPAARRLLTAVERAGKLSPGEGGPDGRLLADRLLVHGRQLHTERGAHATVLESWRGLAEATAVRLSRADADGALREAARGAPLVTDGAAGAGASRRR